MRVNFSSKVVAALRTAQLLPATFLIDVGASGGIGEHYRCFGDRLSAIGFDPMVSEVNRLNESEENPAIRYHPAWIECENYASLFPDAYWDPLIGKNDNPWSRLSAIRAIQELQLQSAILAAAGQAEKSALAEDRYSIDSFIEREAIADVDIIKIDTDGHDFEVLLGAHETLSKCRVLALELEIQFHGPQHPCANVFSNIDTFLRAQGFSLFEMKLQRYSRGVLPARFIYDFPAQTESGQVQWADTIYFRDLAHPKYFAMHRFSVDRDKALKLACLFDIFGLPDCAAELLLMMAQEQILDAALSRQLLDCLVPTGESYDAFLQGFDRDPTTFYASRVRS